MSTEEYNVDLIDRYLLRTLSQEDKEAFEQQLQRDFAFAERVMDYASIIEAIKRAEYEKFRDQLTKWEAAIAKAESPRRTLGNRLFMFIVPAVIVAALAGVLLVYFVQRGQDVKTRCAHLFHVYFSPYDDIVIIRKSKGNSLLSHAFEEYDRGRYKKARQFFLHYLKLQPGDASVRFYLGWVQLALGDDQVAMQNFFLVANDGAGRYREQAEWYIALAYLKAGNAVAAKNQLEHISASPKHSRYGQATQLKGRLEAEIEVN